MINKTGDEFNSWCKVFALLLCVIFLAMYGSQINTHRYQHFGEDTEDITILDTQKGIIYTLSPKERMVGRFDLINRQINIDSAKVEFSPEQK